MNFGVYVTPLLKGFDKNGCPRSYALVAQEDGDTIVPRADELGFVIAGADVRDLKVLAYGPWQHVQNVAGELLEPMEGYPPRYRIRHFPDSKQLELIGIAQGCLPIG